MSLINMSIYTNITMINVYYAYVNMYIYIYQYIYIYLYVYMYNR